MSVRVLVAEDEDPQRAALLVLLAQRWPEAEVVAECSDGLAALEALEEHTPDVAFLDIRMPGISGLEVAKAALERGCRVVFTTAFDHYAVQAFEQGAIDYLLKPLRPERLDAAIARLRLDGARPGPMDAEALRDALARSEPLRRLQWISANLGDTLRLLAIDDVQAFHAEDKMTRVMAADGEALIRTPLRELLPQLDPETFWQVHRSLIVQLRAVDRVRKDELGRHLLRLRGRAEEFPVSQAAVARFRNGSG